ncbi:Hypothetical predicted protein, partial [Marmota monax]
RLRAGFRCMSWPPVGDQARSGLSPNPEEVLCTCILRRLSGGTQDWGRWPPPGLQREVERKAGTLRRSGILEQPPPG